MGRNAQMDNRRAMPTGVMTPVGNPVTGPFFALAGVDPEIWPSPKQLAAYTVIAQPLFGGTSIVVPFTVKDEADFLVMGLSASVQNPGVAPVGQVWGGTNQGGFMSTVLVQITDTLVEYDWFSQPVPLDNIADGSPGSPGVMVYGYRCTAGSVINTMFISLQAINTNFNIFLTFWGAEVFA